MGQLQASALQLHFTYSTIVHAQQACRTAGVCNGCDASWVSAFEFINNIPVVVQPDCTVASTGIIGLEGVVHSG